MSFSTVNGIFDAYCICSLDTICLCIKNQIWPKDGNHGIHTAMVERTEKLCFMIQSLKMPLMKLFLKYCHLALVTVNREITLILIEYYKFVQLRCP